MRVVACAILALVLVALGALQLASDAYYESVAAPYALPTRVPFGFARSIYGALDRAAPFAFVEETLAEHALATGDLAGAQRHASMLADRPARDELLARIALARGDRASALQYFFDAPDVDALRREAVRRAAVDPAGAYAFERAVRDRLTLLGTHPDAVAQADWIMGSIALRCAKRAGASRRMWLLRARADDVAAANLAPFNKRYLTAAAVASLRLGYRAEAQRWYRRVLRVDPAAHIR